jgi:hypothetical protein
MKSSREIVDEKQFYDPFGVLWTRSNGGYLMEPCKPLPSEIPVENAMAFIQALKKARNFIFT